MLIVERLLMLTLENQDKLSGVNGLLSKAHVAAAMADLEDEGVISFTAANLYEPWNMDDPLVELAEHRTPSHPGLNALHEAIHKKDGRELSFFIKKGGLDPRPELLAEMARNGVVTKEKLGPFRGSLWHPVLPTTTEEVSGHLTFVMQGSAEPSRADRMLLGILEAINMTGLVLSNTEFAGNQKRVSQRVHELDGAHPVLTVLNNLTGGMTGLMTKSALGPVRQQS